MPKTLTRFTPRTALWSDSLPALKRRGRPLVALCLVAAVLNLCAPAAFASAAPAAGELTAVGAVAVDGAPAASGQTFFSGSTLTTGPGGRVTVGVGRLARLGLEPETSLRLDFSTAGVTGSLGGGLVRVSAPAGLPADVRTADASVVADGGGTALFNVRFEGGATTVSVQTGRVELRGAGGSRAVAAGETLSSVGEAADTPEPDEKRRLGLGLGIAGAIAVLIIVIVGRGDDDVLFDECVGPIVPSGDGSDPCQ
jgi:ferric-dicitrate binding protein FerR (iron transport regulator)